MIPTSQDCLRISDNVYSAVSLLSKISFITTRRNTEVKYPFKRFHFPIFEMGAGGFYTSAGGLNSLLHLMLNLNSVKAEYILTNR